MEVLRHGPCSRTDNFGYDMATLFLRPDRQTPLEETPARLRVACEEVLRRGVETRC